MLLVAITLLSVSCRSTGDPSAMDLPSTVSTPLTPDPQADWTPSQGFDHLVAARCFAFGGVGFAGITTPEEFAFRAVMRSPDSTELFKQAFSKATNEGKLYALCGLRATDRPAFDAYAATVIKRNPKVSTASGCLFDTEPAADVLQRITNGVYDPFFTKR